MFSIIKNLWDRTDGAAMIYTAILLPIFIGFLALGLDVASWHISKRQIQTMADAAAFAAMLENVQNSSDTTLSQSALVALYEAEALDVATRNGFNAGGGDTIAVNSPPTLGETAGTAGAIEVIISTPLPLLLAALLTEGEQFASARAVAMSRDIGDGCMFALNPNADGAITVSGNSDVQLDCGMYSNSASTSSIQLNGVSSCVKATEINVVGEVDSGAGGCFDPAPNEGVASSGDPLSSLPEPSFSGCDYSGNTQYNGNSSGTLTPGVYCGDIKLNTKGTVQFAPGLYILDGGGLTIGAQAQVNGTGVTIFFINSSGPSDSIVINSGSDVQISPPTSGTYEAVLMFQSRSDPDTIEHTFNGGADMHMNGIMYFPNQDLKFAGSSDFEGIGTILIADEIKITGNSDFQVKKAEGENALTNPFLIGATLLVE